MNNPTTDLPTEIPAHVRELQPNWGWFIIFGLISLMAGVLAVVLPATASLAVELLVGCILVLEGILALIQAFRMGGRGMFVRLLGGVLALVAGGLLLFYPLTGVLTLTLIVAAFLIVNGVFKLILSTQIRPAAGNGWLGFSAFLSIILGLLIVFVLPQAASWVIGLLFGIDLIFAAVWLLYMGASLKRL